MARRRTCNENFRRGHFGDLFFDWLALPLGTDDVFGYWTSLNNVIGWMSRAASYLLKYLALDVELGLDRLCVSTKHGAKQGVRHTSVLHCGELAELSTFGFKSTANKNHWRWQYQVYV